MPTAFDILGTLVILGVMLALLYFGWLRSKRALAHLDATIDGIFSRQGLRRVRTSDGMLLHRGDRLYEGALHGRSIQATLAWFVAPLWPVRVRPGLFKRMWYFPWTEEESWFQLRGRSGSALRFECALASSSGAVQLTDRALAEHPKGRRWGISFRYHLEEEAPACPLGDAEVEAAFVVRSTDPAAARRLLAHREVRRKLLDLRQLELVIAADRVVLDDLWPDAATAGVGPDFEAWERRVALVVSLLSDVAAAMEQR